MLHQNLWNANADLARACLEHPFVQGLGDGSLARQAFKRYVAQDAFFLRAFFRAYALGAARSEQVAHAEAFHMFMGGALQEMKLHKSYAATWDIDLTGVKPLPATRAYTDFLLRSAWHSGVGQTIAAMTPCMRLYAYLGRELAGTSKPDNPYHPWVEQYSDPEFDKLAGAVEALLDSVAGDTAAVRDAYRYAMQCELAFFDAPLEQAS